MVRFRLLAAALALSASACSIWFLATGPLDGLDDASADAQLADAEPTDTGPDDGGPDASIAPPAQIADHVGALAVYQGTLYANGLGQVYVYDEDGGKLDLLIAHGASVDEFRGIAVDDAGIFWTADDGIWSADLDGGGVLPEASISDPNNPQVLAADGQRLSWTTYNGSSIAVIHSCGRARGGGACKFGLIVKGLGDSGITGGGGGSGEGGATELAGPDADVDPLTLAAGDGYVAWVSTQSNDVEMTSVVTNKTNPISASADKTFGMTSDDSFVANYGPTILWSFHNDNHALIIRRASSPGDTTGALVFALPPNSYATKSLCFAAGAGLAVDCITKDFVQTADEYDGGNARIGLGDAATPIATAATSKWVFVIDTNYALWRYPRN